MNVIKFLAKKFSKKMEMGGIEPPASTMLKSHSTTEPHPLFKFSNNFNYETIQKEDDNVDDSLNPKINASICKY